jgi:hypothetical protein
MVNVRFPRSTGLWFRNGGRAGLAQLAGINRKFTANQDARAFWRIFSANFRAFNFKANTRALLTTASHVRIADQPQTKMTGSRDVFPAAHGILARARARAAAKGQNT